MVVLQGVWEEKWKGRVTEHVKESLLSMERKTKILWALKVSVLYSYTMITQQSVDIYIPGMLLSWGFIEQVKQKNRNGSGEQILGLY